MPAKVWATPGPPPLVTAPIAEIGVCSCPKLGIVSIDRVKRRSKLTELRQQPQGLREELFEYT